MISHNQEIYAEESFLITSTLSEILVGLSRPQKTLPAKLLYDDHGSQIFEEICQTQDYYITRAETEIFREHAPEMAKFIGQGAIIIEPGSGVSEKIRYLLPELNKIRAYVPIEISPEPLLKSCDVLTRQFPGLEIVPILGDFEKEIIIPGEVSRSSSKKLIFFPGSTIGNFSPSQAALLLRQWARLAGKDAMLLIGVDRKKGREKLIKAYDDQNGITADFNLNILRRINREANANFDLTKFSHQARYNDHKGRVEMHLVSREDQMVKVHDSLFRFQAGESIHTESSYKYTPREFKTLAEKAQFNYVKHWCDREGLFCVYFFNRAGTHHVQKQA
jgi:L-histidine Nalpha-methyltransferase